MLPRAFLLDVSDWRRAGRPRAVVLRVRRGRCTFARPRGGVVIRAEVCHARDDLTRAVVCTPIARSPLWHVKHPDAGPWQGARPSRVA